MKKLLFLSSFLSLLIFGNPYYSYSQSVGVSGTGAAPNPSALLDIDAAGMDPKGLLMPRLTTTQRDAIATTCSCTPAEGLMVFNTTTKCVEMYVNSGWYSLGCPAACTPPATPTANAATILACTSFTANWSASSGATSYYLDVATDAGFTTFVSGFNNINVNNVTSYSVTGLTAGITYYYRLRAATACVSSNSNAITAVTTATPSAAGSISGTTPVCQSQNGVAFSVGAISGATSYTWSYSGTGFTCASNCTTNSITANFSGTATGGNLTVYGTNTCGNGTTSSNYAIAVSATPTIANAGAAINPICGVTTATLAGNNPSAGTGIWSWVSGTVPTITSSGAYNSGVTGLAVPGTTRLRWTISNSPCAASTSDVVITTSSATVTGGTLSSDATYNYRTFLTNGTLSITCGSLTCDVLIVAGGGGGGGSGTGYHGGGGGGGGYLEGTLTGISGTYTVTIGAGGAGGAASNGSQGTNGSNSLFGSYVAYGGGAGGTAANGKNGGSGGGQGGTGVSGTSTQTSQSPLIGYGNAANTDGGGNSNAGAGAGGIGTQYTPGVGKASSISGSSVTYAAGGYEPDNTCVAGANSGNGGCGRSNGGGAIGATGGSGIVIVRYTRVQTGD